MRKAEVLGRRFAWFLVAGGAVLLLAALGWTLAVAHPGREPGIGTLVSSGYALSATGLVAALYLHYF